MIEDPRNYSSIGNLLRRYSNLFLDTNVFLNINVYLDKKKREENLQYFRTMEDLSDFWTPTLRENENIYLTRNILSELRRDHFNYKKELKKPHSFAKERVEVMRIKQRLKNKRNSFLDEFPSERIIDLSTLEDRALYDELNRKYNFFTKPSESFEGIGKEDLDLLLLGGVFSKTRGKTCLISNDFGILRSYKNFLILEKESKENYGFYLEKGINLFKKV